MAGKVTQRFWTGGPRGGERAAWGYTVQIDGKQVRCFREEWTKDDAAKELAARLLGVTPEGAPVAPVGMTLGTMLEKFLEARGKSKRNKSVKDDTERSRPLLAFFGKDTPVSAITTARVREYRLHRQGVTSRRGRL